MTEVFADTSGWANYFVRSEPFSQLAVSRMRQWYATGDRLVTTNYVLIELVALMTSPLRIPRPQQIRTIEAIQTATWVEVIHIDPTLHDEAWRLLTKRPDKEWSLVDCSSMVIMARRGIAEAFTSDHHFEQGGFARSLK
jgi:predicted nucleic acid-binding protein